LGLQLDTGPTLLTISTAGGAESAPPVPEREQFAPILRFYFDASVSTKPASSWPGSCSSSAHGGADGESVLMIVLTRKRDTVVRWERAVGWRLAAWATTSRRRTPG